MATALLVLTAAVTFKITVAIVALAGWIIAVIQLYRARRFRQLALAVSLSVVLIGSWLGRGVVLSGYPLYPVAALAAPVDWRVPEEQALAETAWPRYAAWTRNTPAWGHITVQQVCHPTSLLKLWLVKLGAPDYWWQVALPAVLMVVLIGAAMRYRPSLKFSDLFLIWFGAVAIAGIAWFVGAPRPNHLLGEIWTGAAIAAAFATYSREQRMVDTNDLGYAGR